MPRRSKIDIQKVKVSLSSTCPQCRYKIEPHELLRIDNDRVRCPKCLAAVTPTKREA